jgi:cell pole-organizing protein PopZ
MAHADVGVDKSMDEILEQVQREYAEKSGEPQISLDTPRSAEVHNLNQVGSGRKGRSSSRAEASQGAEDENENPSEAAELAEPPMSAAPAGATMTVLAQLAALQAARHRASEFPMGNTARTLEDVMREALRPMLQGWLEEKLPTIVERLIKAELSRAMAEVV